MSSSCLPCVSLGGDQGGNVEAKAEQPHNRADGNGDWHALGSPSEPESDGDGLRPTRSRSVSIVRPHSKFVKVEQPDNCANGDGHALGGPSEFREQRNFKAGARCEYVLDEDFDAFCQAMQEANAMEGIGPEINMLKYALVHHTMYLEGTITGPVLRKRFRVMAEPAQCTADERLWDTTWAVSENRVKSPSWYNHQIRMEALAFTHPCLKAPIYFHHKRA